MDHPSSPRSWSLPLYLAYLGIVLAWYLICIPLHPVRTLVLQASTILHHRIDLAQMAGIWTRHLLVLTAGWALLSIVLHAGRNVLRLFRDDVEDDEGAWTWSLALGMLLFATLSTSLALLKILFPALLAGILIIFLAMFMAKDGFRFLFRPFLPFRIWMNWPVLWKVPSALLFLISLTGLLAPEMSWDAMTYQLNLPVYYLIEHGFFPAERIVPAQAPALGQMVMVWGQALGDDRIGRLLHFMSHIAVAAALYHYGKKAASPGAGAMAALLYWSVPFFLTHSYRGYVDHFVALYTVLGFLELIRWAGSDPEGRRVSGAMAALSLGALGAFKYTAPMFWVPAGILILVVILRERRGIGVLMLTAGSAVLWAAPWFLKSWAYTGNPVYPYLTGIFATFDWTVFDARASALKFPVEGFSGLAKIPAVLYGAVFQNRGGALYEDVGPFGVLLAPLLFLRFGRPVPSIVRPTLLLAVGLGIWSVTSHQVRLVFGFYAVLCLLLATAWNRAEAHWERGRPWLQSAVAVVLFIQAFSLAWGVFQQSNPLPHVLGLESRESYRQATLKPDGYPGQMSLMDRSLPEDARVLFIGVGNAYTLRRRAVYDFDSVEPALKKWAAGARDPGTLYRRFRQRGITHILYHESGSMGAAMRAAEIGLDRYYYSDADVALIEGFFLRYTRRTNLSAERGFHLLEVVPREGFAPPLPYLPGTEGYYLEALRGLMGLSSPSELGGRRIPVPVQRAVHPAVAAHCPTLGQARFQAALSAETPGNDAIRYAQEGFAINGDEASWELFRGRRWILLGRSAKAVPHLERARSLSPERAEAVSNLAVAYYNVRRFPEAVRMMEEASRLDPLNEDYSGIVRQWKASRILLE